jgi:signal transduction histidine kinase
LDAARATADAQARDRESEVEMSDRRVLKRLEAWPKGGLLALVVALIAVVGVCDYLTGFETTVSVFYVMPVFIASWCAGGWGGLLASALSVSAWILADRLAGHAYTQGLILYWNAAVMFCFFFLIALFALVIQRDRDDQARLMRELRATAEERRQLNERLVEQTEQCFRSNRELEQFASVVAHDLRSPLVGIGGFANLLRRRHREALGADGDLLVGHIVDGAARTQALIEDLLAYARLGADEGPLETVDCQALVKEVLETLAPQIEERGAVVTQEDLPRLTGNRTQLTRVFQNLIANALKFQASQQPQIHVRSENKGDAWLFSVRDNGIGIPADQRERVFQIFQRVHGEEDYPGTGIGLSICKKVVEAHGGRIWVESAPGEGSTFYFTIPARMAG